MVSEDGFFILVGGFLCFEGFEERSGLRRRSWLGGCDYMREILVG